MPVRRSIASVVAMLVAVLVLHVAVGGASPRRGSAGCSGARDFPVDAPTRAKARVALLCLVNRARTARRLGPVRPSAPLAAAATRHSDEMVAGKYFAHYGIGGDTLSDRARAAGYRNTRGLGEALAWAEAAAPVLLRRRLMASRPHRRILLGRSAREIGIGLSLGAPIQGVSRPSATLVLVLG